MVDVTTETIIDVPQDTVAAFASDPDNATAWYKNIKSVEWKTPKPLTIGSRIAFTAKFLGKELSYVYEITELIPGEKLVMRTAQGPFPMETTYRWETVDNNKTRMILKNAGKPSGFSKWFAPFMAWAMIRANKKDLQQLKTILEKE